MLAGFRLVALPALLLAAFPTFGAPPTQEEIDKAAGELGDKRFAVREKATKLLWEAGAAAEPALRKALQTGDTETVRRAQGLLDKFEWGIYPDTPAEIVTLISKFKGGDQAQRIEVVSKLSAMGRGGFATLRRLSNMTVNPEERKAVFDQMSIRAQQTVPTMILAGDLAFAEELLDLCLISESERAAVNYAAYQYLRGKLDASIERWQKEIRDPKRDAKAGEVLVRLLRIKGDLAAAKKLAEQMENDTLHDVLWEDSDWKGLAKLIRKHSDGRQNEITIGGELGIFALAGDNEGYEKCLHDVRNLVQTGDENGWGTEALLLNGHAKEAIDLLLGKKRMLSRTFDLLCAQLKFREAFEFAHTGENLEALTFNMARALYLLGQREEALQLFTESARVALASDAGRPDSPLLTIELIKILNRLALEERADEVCALSLNRLAKDKRYDACEQVLDPLFGKNTNLAFAWWRFLAERSTSEAPGSIVKKVRDLLEGKPVAERAELCRKMAEWTDPNRPIVNLVPDDTPNSPAERSEIQSRKILSQLAAAEAMRMAGQDEAAQQYFEKAVKAGASVDAWIRFGDFLAGKKRYAEAAQQYAKAAGRQPDQPIALFLQGWALIKAGKEQDGRRCQELAHWMPLGSVEIRYDFAQELGKREFADAARQERDFIMKTGWYCYGYTSNLLIEWAQQAAARNDFATAARLYQKSTIARMRFGAADIEDSAYLLVAQAPVHYRIRQLIAEDKLDEAAKEIAACLEVLPGDVELAIGLVPELEKKGRKKEADDLYSKVLRPYEELSNQHPQSAYLRNDCAWLAANCRRDLDKALEHAQAAVKLEPKAAGYIDTLAEVHFRRGEKEKAMELMKQCISLKPRNPYYRKQLERFTKGDIDTDPPPEAEDD